MEKVGSLHKDKVPPFSGVYGKLDSRTQTVTICGNRRSRWCQIQTEVVRRRRWGWGCTYYFVYCSWRDSLTQRCLSKWVLIPLLRVFSGVEIDTVNTRDLWTEKDLGWYWYDTVSGHLYKVILGIVIKSKKRSSVKYRDSLLGQETRKRRNVKK